MSYFVDVVLKSAGLPEKPSYTIPEVLHCLQVSRATLLAMIRDGRFPKPFEPDPRPRTFGQGGTPTKRFYKQTLIEYFEKRVAQQQQKFSDDRTKKHSAASDT